MAFRKIIDWPLVLCILELEFLPSAMLQHAVWSIMVHGLFVDCIQLPNKGVITSAQTHCELLIWAEHCG